MYIKASMQDISFFGIHVFLTLAMLWGGGTSPLFFENSKKTWHSAPPFFAYIIINIFDNFPENFVTRSSQVRSPGYVKWPYLKKMLSTLATIFELSTWDLQIKLSVATKYISLIFYFCHLRSGQFCELPIMSRLKKTESLLYTLGPVILW